MKKILFTLFLSIGVFSTTLKGVDSSLFCVKNHESLILNDQKWHTFKFFTGLNDYVHVTAIKIKQKDTGFDYEFKSTSKNAMLDFYQWQTNKLDLDYNFWYNVTDISMEKSGDGYVGSFYSQLFVPYVDNRPTFIGIDVF